MAGVKPLTIYCEFCKGDIEVGRAEFITQTLPGDTLSFVLVCGHRVMGKSWAKKAMPGMLVKEGK